LVCVSWFCVRVYSINIFQHLKYLKGSWAVLFRSGHIGSSSRGEPLITYEICNIINMLFLKGEFESLVFVLKCLLLTFYKVQNTIWLRKACVLDLFWISNIQIIWHPSSCLKCFYPSPSDLNFSSTAPPPSPQKRSTYAFSPTSAKKYGPFYSLTPNCFIHKSSEFLNAFWLHFIQFGKFTVIVLKGTRHNSVRSLFILIFRL